MLKSYLFSAMVVAILKWRQLLPDPKTKWNRSGGGGNQTKSDVLSSRHISRDYSTTHNYVSMSYLT